MKIPVLIFFFLAYYFQLFCQDNSIKKERKFFEEGVILSSPNNIFDDMSYDISKVSEDPHIIGVATGNRQPKTWTEFIRTSGTAKIKYNSENGPIKKGDLITSSSTPGEGMKAKQSGMVVGMAIEDATAPAGLIKCRVLIQYVKQ